MARDAIVDMTIGPGGGRMLVALICARLHATVRGSGDISACTPPMSTIFHLSFPVSSLAGSLAFYQDCLGATPGRRTPGWCDLILFGHQLTIHQQPEQVRPRGERGVRHFGAILSRDDWEAVRARAVSYDPGLAQAVQHRFAGDPNEHVKLLIEDPDGYLIEIKAYGRLDTVSPHLHAPEA